MRWSANGDIAIELEIGLAVQRDNGDFRHDEGGGGNRHNTDRGLGEGRPPQHHRLRTDRNLIEPPPDHGRCCRYESPALWALIVSLIRSVVRPANRRDVPTRYGARAIVGPLNC
uniref:Uncharacterized protein n=1 Tax=Spongospora subterranea TaxID=70186 RepID=A0A0H5RC57_9EUKA|eukprot:CRZ11331.1 hypothetical protein [Spongospora subterranea]